MFLIFTLLMFFHSGFAQMPVDNSDIEKSIEKSTEKYNALRWNAYNVEHKNGKIDRGDWYEWWYAKFVDPKTNEAVLFSYRNCESLG